MGEGIMFFHMQCFCHNIYREMFTFRIVKITISHFQLITINIYRNYYKIYLTVLYILGMNGSWVIFPRGIFNSKIPKLVLKIIWGTNEKFIQIFVYIAYKLFYRIDKMGFISLVYENTPVYLDNLLIFYLKLFRKLVSFFYILKKLILQLVRICFNFRLYDVFHNS